MVQTEKVRKEFAQRLAQACDQAGIDEHGRGVTLARALNVTSKAVSKWLNAEALPRQEKINALAQYLKVDVVWLQHGGDNKRTESNVSYAGRYEPKRCYPLISMVKAGEWNEAVEPYSLQNITEWYDSDAHVQGHGFWLRVEGDSMTAPVGVSIPEGTLVLVDTGREPKNGNLVIAKLTDSNEATFKKLIIDGGQRYLKGLNPAWPLIPINGDCRIIGVAIETKMRLV